MKVSIIIPFHKGISFLDDCLQSIKEQSYKRIEVILICDHIEENLESIISSYLTEFNLIVHYLKENYGVAAARNKGLTLSTGDYIYFLDSDDYLEADTLNTLVSIAASDNTDIIFGRTIKTWFKRNTFLSNRKQNSEHVVNDNKETAFDFSELNGLEKPSDNLIEAVVDARFNRVKAYKRLISAKKGLKDISILNILIKHSLIKEHHLCFNENLYYFSDYPFLFQVLHYADSFFYQKDCRYIKRYHNDPINHPSLSQMISSKNHVEFINSYQYTIGLSETDPELRTILDKKILKFLAFSFAPKLHRETDKIEVNRQFHEMHLLIQNIDPKLIRKYHGYKRRLYKAILSGNLKKTVSVVKLHLALKKLKKIIRSKSELKMTLYKHIFLKQKMKENWVLCESFFGKNYSDNPKYIYEYISKNQPEQYRFIWVINKNDTYIPYKHTRIKRFSILYFYYLARCKYYIFNSRQPEWAVKREGNVFLQTWHGTPLKRLVFDIDDISSATASYKKQVYNQSRSWDYLIAPNQFSSDVFKSCFMYENTMLETGYPRNDILHYENREKLAEGIRKKLGIPLNKKTILYAPTWRDDEYYAKGKYKFSLQIDLQMLKEKLEDDYVILLRTHYFIADNLDITDLGDFVFNLSKYDDIAHLYLISDILITDYSSVFFDYANLKRPMLFYMYDLDKYRDVLRGFYINIEEELPGPILVNTEEVLNAVMNIPKLEQDYQEKYKQFYQKFCAWEDGRASERIVKRIFGSFEENQLDKVAYRGKRFPRNTLHQ